MPFGTHISTPGNVITFTHTHDVTGDQKNVMNLLREGSMVMIGQDITRFNPDTLEFVKFGLYGPKTWTPGRSVDLNCESTQYSVFFVKCSDLFYGQHHSTLFVKNDGEWFEFKFGAWNQPNGLGAPESPPRFIKNNNMSSLVYNIVTNKEHTFGYQNASWEVVEDDYLPWSTTDQVEDPLGDNSIMDNIMNYPYEDDVLNLINGADSDDEEESDSDADYEDEVLTDSESDTTPVGNDDLEEGEVYESSDSDSDYTPEDDEDDEDDDENDDEYDEYDEYADYAHYYYDELREDVCGGWYTRREFYDYYGSDEAWDNINPNEFHPLRFDDVYNEWHTEEEFFQYYGTSCVWDNMHPEKNLMRTAIWNTHWWSTFLPKNTRKKFIKDMLKTY